jgi:UDP-N-acetylmuramyl pentapeptide phosphotransferase/UDP-N-acetylglucosamine-1-phosphate transferase
MAWWELFIAFISAFTGTAILMRPFLSYLRTRSILDIPNNRSSHTIPTPKGGGAVLIIIAAIGWLIITTMGPAPPSFTEIAVLLAITLSLAAMSWVDDLKGLSALLRLSAHLAGTTAAYMVMPKDALLFQGLVSPFIEGVIIILAWVWFINLFNFMDGIDGISGIETIIISAGVVLLSLFAPKLLPLAPYGAVLAGAAMGFLIWNWFPAKIFLGDVGSAPLGYLIGWLLISTANAGEWLAALILPAYYLADATITLIRRIMRKQKFWLAHREHFYQQAVSKGRSHGHVSLTVLLVGIVLIFCSLASVISHSLTAPLIAALTVLGVLIYFKSDETS